MTGLEHAVLGLDQALDSPPRHQMWRWLVRHRIAGVKDALTGPGSPAWAAPGDSGLAAREAVLHREAEALLERLGRLGPQVLAAPDVEPVRNELKRLVADLEHHRQRVNDLLYDGVALELGGSE